MVIDSPDMERRLVVPSLLAGLALPSTDVASGQTKKEAIFVRAGEDRSHTAVTIAKCKLSGRDTNGTLSIFGGDAKPPGGVPLHVHHDQDEWWYVLDGEHLFQIGDKKIRAKAGDSLFGPRGVPHSPRQLSPQGTVLTAFQPAGTMEEFFQELAKAAREAGGVPAREVMAALFQAHRMQIVGPMVEP